jgi:hypothetical protein
MHLIQFTKIIRKKCTGRSASKRRQVYTVIARRDVHMNIDCQLRIAVRCRIDYLEFSFAARE